MKKRLTIDDSIEYKVQIENQAWSCQCTGTYEQCEAWIEQHPFSAYKWEIRPNTYKQSAVLTKIAA